MTAALKEADCFGAILRSSGGTFTFVSGETGKVYDTLDRNGFKVIKGSGKAKEENVVSLRALKTLIAVLEKEGRE